MPTTTATRTTPGTRSKRLLALLLSTLLILTGPVFGSVVSAQDETAQDPAQVETEEPASPNMDAAQAAVPPTEIVPPTEVIPTAAPEPTEVPAEPTEPPAPPTVTPTIAPTPVVVPDTLACDPASIAQNGAVWQFQSDCAYVVNSSRAETHVRVTIASATTEGWAVELRDPASGAWIAAGIVDSSSVAPGSAIRFAVRITAPATSQGGEQATVQIASETVAVSGETAAGPGATIGAVVPRSQARTSMAASAAAPAPMSCSGPVPVASQPGLVGYDCTYAIEFPGNGNAEVTINASASNGWSIGLEATLKNGATTLNRSSSLAVGKTSITYAKGGGGDTRVWTGQIQVLLQPPTGGGSAPATVSLSHACTSPFEKFCGSELPATSFSVTAPTPCADPAGSGVTAALTGVTLTPVTYSALAQQNSGTMTLDVDNPNRCTGWSVSISGTDLRYSGSAPNQSAIPAGNLHVTAPGKPAVPLSAQATPLITGGGSATSYSYTLGLTLDIPGTSAAGIYTTTITVNTTSAP